MRAIDIFGLAVAIVIAGLAQIVTPWSGPWWGGMIVAGLIAVATGAHLFWTNLSEAARTTISPAIWKPTGYLRPWIGILLLCILMGGAYVGSRWPTSFLHTDQSSPSGASGRTAPEITLPLASRLDHFILNCDIPPPVGRTSEQFAAELDTYKKNMNIVGDAMGASYTITPIRGGIRIEAEAVTEEAKRRALPFSAVGVTKLIIEVRRVEKQEIVSVLVNLPSQLAFFSLIPPNTAAPDTIVVRRWVEKLLGARDGACRVI
jgi:hypothetical protein